MKKEKKKNMKLLKKKVQPLSDIKLEKLLTVLANRYHNKSFRLDKDYFKVGGSI